MPKLSALTPIDDLVKRLVVDNSACTLTSWDVERAADSLAETPPSEAELACAREAMLENLVRLQVVASRAFALHRADERRDAEQKEQQRKAAIEAARRPWLEAKVETATGVAEFWARVFGARLTARRVIRGDAGVYDQQIDASAARASDLVEAGCPSNHVVIRAASRDVFERFVAASSLPITLATERDGAVFALYATQGSLPFARFRGESLAVSQKIPLWGAGTKWLFRPDEVVAHNPEQTGCPLLPVELAARARMFNLNTPEGVRMFEAALLGAVAVA